MWVGLEQPVEGLARTKGLTSPKQEGILQWMALGLHWQHWLFLVRQQTAFGVNVPLSSESPACRAPDQILDSLSLQSCGSQFLEIHLFLYIYAHPIGSVSLGNLTKTRWG